jgi:hypothetical protein
MARWQQYVMDRLLRAALPALLQVGGGRGDCRHSMHCAVLLWHAVQPLDC